MGPRYTAIASFVRQGPALLRINLGEGVEARFVVGSVSPPAAAPPEEPFSSFTYGLPAGTLCLDEDQIAHVQPEASRRDSAFHHSDNGTSLELTRPPEVPTLLRILEERYPSIYSASLPTSRKAMDAFLTGLPLIWGSRHRVQSHLRRVGDDARRNVAGRSCSR